MVDARSLWLAIPEPVRRFPADLATVVALAVLTGVVATLPVVRETPVVLPFAFSFALFLPGYAVTAVVFPERNASRRDDDGEDASAESDSETVGFPRKTRPIGGLERATLSVGLSIALVPLVGMALVLTNVGFRLVPIVLSVGGVTVVSSIAAAVRRRRLRPENRFRVPYQRWWAKTRGGSWSGESRGDTGLNVLLALSLLAAVSSVGYAVAVHEEGEPFTEFYLATENETGALVTDDYPTNFTAGESESLIVGIGNHERQPTNYSTVVLLQRVAPRNDTVIESRRLGGFDARIEANDTVHYRHEVRPTMTGEQLRLQFLLYRGDPPATPTRENAYRRTHFWVNVTAPENT